MNEKKKKKNGKRRTILHNSNLEFEKPLLTINFFKNIHKSMSSDLSIAKISVNRIAESKFQFDPSLFVKQPTNYTFSQTIPFVSHTATHTLLTHHIHFARTKISKNIDY